MGKIEIDGEFFSDLMSELIYVRFKIGDGINNYKNLPEKKLKVGKVWIGKCLTNNTQGVKL